METLRTHGEPPYRVAVVHGGPGAGGEMAPVARKLASSRGVLEPIQTATALDGQVDELRRALEAHGNPPMTLIGFSWGAWLSFVTAARYADLIQKLILVGAGPFEERYVAELQETRMHRLSPEERTEWGATVEALADPGAEEKDRLTARLGALAAKADAYKPRPYASEAADSVGARGDIFQAVWEDAVALRRSGELLALGQCISCPVVAVHGDHDPHPVEGVEKPLAGVLDQFRLVLLQHCGHKPWIERWARDPFFEVLEEEIL